ncbi:MAG: Exodeoxyribonuclease [Myxococcaceae bacterium]|nr:Exodeoxyribonuclease [Myxococcaceae bacterium]
MLKVTTWNVNGVRARKAELPTFIDRERPDVLCLQEIKATPEKVPPELLELPGYWTYWHGHGGYSGVALLLSKARFAEPPTFSHPSFDHETRVVVARAGELTIASIYVPNGGKDFEAKLRFLDGLDAYIAESQRNGEQLLICGDLNVAREERDVHPSLRKSDQIGTTADEREQFARMLGHGLVDLSRKFEPDNDRLFTWWAPWRNMREKNIGWRIDYVLASASLAERATACAAAREFGTSDHAPLTASFDV